jgi:hypothetical protein
VSAVNGGSMQHRVQHDAPPNAPIFNAPAQDILSLFEASTAHHYYAAEIQELTKYSKTTVLGLLHQFREIEILDSWRETVDFSTRPLRTFYVLTAHGLELMRLTPLPA